METICTKLGHPYEAKTHVRLMKSLEQPLEWDCLHEDDCGDKEMEDGSQEVGEDKDPEDDEDEEMEDLTEENKAAGSDDDDESGESEEDEEKGEKAESNSCISIYF